jgi:hypothetical protein
VKSASRRSCSSSLRLLLRSEPVADDRASESDQGGKDCLYPAIDEVTAIDRWQAIYPPGVDGKGNNGNSSKHTQNEPTRGSCQTCPHLRIFGDILNANSVRQSDCEDVTLFLLDGMKFNCEKLLKTALLDTINTNSIA